jgi:hypothetical protein
MSPDLPPEDAPRAPRQPDRGKGACFTRVEAAARGLALSCTPALWLAFRRTVTP